MLAHALRGIFYPSHFLYPHTSRYLLQRPELDRSDIPMLLSMLYSSSDDAKKERLWMLRLIRDGLRSDMDWRVVRRRHVLDMLGSMFEGSPNDHSLRSAVMEILVEIASMQNAVTTLIVRHAWLSWVDLQLSSLTIRRDEDVLWLKMIHQLSLSANYGQLDKLTDGSWRLDIHGCLRRLLSRESITMDMLETASSILRNVGMCKFESIATQSLTLAFASLKKLEGHMSNSEHKSWASIVENLWRFSMELSSPGSIWHQLVSRLLVLNANPRLKSGLSEWARRQVVEALVTNSVETT